MSILKHPEWKKLRSYIKITSRPKNKVGEFGIRLDILPALPIYLSNITMKCVACGAIIYPIRRRKGEGNKRGFSTNYYCSSTCSTNQNPGCSRGKEGLNELKNIGVYMELWEWDLIR